MVVSELVEGAPHAVGGAAAHQRNLGRCIEVAHDGVAGVEVAGADLTVGNDALAAERGAIEAGERAGASHRAGPEILGHRGVGDLERDRGGDGADPASGLNLCPGRAELLHRLPVGERVAAADMVGHRNGALDGHRDGPERSGARNRDVDGAAEAIRDDRDCLCERRAADDAGHAGPAVEAEEGVGVGANLNA